MPGTRIRRVPAARCPAAVTAGARLQQEHPKQQEHGVGPIACGCRPAAAPPRKPVQIVTFKARSVCRHRHLRPCPPYELICGPCAGRGPRQSGIWPCQHVSNKAAKCVATRPPSVLQRQDRHPRATSGSGSLFIQRSRDLQAGRTENRLKPPVEHARAPAVEAAAGSAQRPLNTHGAACFRPRRPGLNTHGAA